MSTKCDDDNIEAFAQTRIEQESDRLKTVLLTQSLSAPKIIQTIVNLVLQHKLPTILFEEPARVLAEYIKDASIFKKRKLALRISKLDFTTKIIIVRQLLSIDAHNFSMELCLSKDSRKGKIKDGVMKFHRPRCEMAMAFGSNKFGRLGIGSMDEKVDRLTHIQLPEEVVRAHIGPSHSIFEMKSGNLYGCGKAANFLDGAKDSEEIITIPVKLTYFKANPQITNNIIVTADYTKIVDYSHCSSLIIGKCESLDPATIRSVGDNWTLVTKSRVWENREAKEISDKEIEVNVYDGTKRKIKTCLDGHWFGKNDVKMEISFLVDGFRVDSEKLWKSYTICSNGIVYALMDHNLYKGKLLIVPRAKAKYSDESDDDDDDEDDVDDDVVLVEKDDVLLVIMEEVVMPMSFDGYGVSEDGEAFVAFSQTPVDSSNTSLEKFLQFRPTEIAPSDISQPDLSTIHARCKTIYDGYRLINIFDSVCKELDIKSLSSLYANCGLPRASNMIRGLIALRHFLRVDKITGLTEVLVNSIKEDNTLDIDKVKKQYEISMELGNKIPVLTVKSDWSAGQLVQRGQELRSRARDYVLEMMGEIQVLLHKFNKLPLKYRTNLVDFEYGIFVEKMIVLINERVFETGSPQEIVMQPLERSFKRRHCEDALKERMANRDLEGDDTRWKAVRVEAVPIVHRNQKLNCLLGEHYVYHVFTTKFHIRCIDQTLLKYVDANDVLNLNVACLDDANPDRYLSLLDSFFMIQDSFIHLNTFERKIDVDAASKSLAAKDKYSIKTSDGFTLKAPKVLFEIYSAYDAGRRRHAMSRGEDPNSFALNFKADAIKLALACLVDVRVFFKADMELKIEAYNIVLYCLFTNIRKELLRMFVLSAEEKDFTHIGDLIWQEPEDMIRLIAKYRPEMVLFWKNLPIHDNYLSVLNYIAIEMNGQHYKKLEAHRADGILLPVSTMQDYCVQKEKVNAKFIKSYMCRDDQDKDVEWDLMKTILAWDTPKTRKRVNEERQPAQPVVRGELIVHHRIGI